MNEIKYPPNWRQFSQARPTWQIPFFFVEWLSAYVAAWLSRRKFVLALDFIAKLSLLVAVITYVAGCPERKRLAEDNRRAKQLQAWQVLALAAGKPGDLGRMQALQTLNADEVPLHEVNLDYAVLSGMSLKRARMAGAKMDRARLEGADFSEADLRNADFTHADLSGAKFKGADLRGAYFLNADLNNADFSGANLSRAMFLQNSKWKKVKSLRGANLWKVETGPSDEFLTWATNVMGAVIVPEECPEKK